MTRNAFELSPRELVTLALVCLEADSSHWSLGNTFIGFNDGRGLAHLLLNKSNQILSPKQFEIQVSGLVLGSHISASCLSNAQRVMCTLPAQSIQSVLPPAFNIFTS